MLGFPIRTPSDHSSVDSSPRLIAASHVLHRLLMPRHPPCALHNLTTKMLASTLQFSNTTPETARTTVRVASGPNSMPANTTLPADTAFHTQPTSQAVLHSTHQQRSLTSSSTIPQAPTPDAHPASPAWTPHQTHSPVEVIVLLRKEVIQPHLPVRLPCYDFVPIASPTFDHSPPTGLGHGLRVLPTFVT